MGFFKDLKQLQDSASELTPPEHRGVMGGFRAMRDGIATANHLTSQMAADSHQAQYLMAAGQPGEATISAIRQTGVMVNLNPECELDLQVSVDGAAPYPVTHRQVIAQVALPSLQPGATIAVRVDPANPQSLIVA
jgi:hypothetical protein